MLLSSLRMTGPQIDTSRLSGHGATRAASVRLVLSALLCLVVAATHGALQSRLDVHIQGHVPPAVPVRWQIVRERAGGSD